MRKRTTAELKRRTGADMRAQRDQRLARPYEMQEAGRREASFLKNIATAGQDLEWILGNRAWRQLGFDRAGDWWDARIRPAFDLLDVRPSHSLIERALAAITDDEQDLPAAQRRTQRELAALMKVSPASISRSRTGSGETRSDLDSDSSDGVEGTSSEVELPADSGTESLRDDVALVAGQPGTLSPVASGGPDPVSPVTRPSGGPSSGEEPVFPEPAAPEEETFDSSSGAQNLTEGQAPNPSTGPVLSPAAVPGVAVAGDERGEVGEESEAGQQGFSSTDPDSVIAWFETVADMGEEIDLAVLGPLLGSADIRRIERAHERISVVVRLLRERMGS